MSREAALLKLQSGCFPEMQEEMTEAGMPEVYATLQISASATQYTQKQLERLENTGQLLQPTYLQLVPELKPGTCDALRRLRFLVNTTIVMTFSVTIATKMTMPAASQVAHSGNELNTAVSSVWSNYWLTCAET